MPLKEKECVAGWKKFYPDYEFKIWNEDNFDYNKCIYARQAYERGYYAFVSDYVRAKVLYEYGGIYLDTDVKISEEQMRSVIDKIGDLSEPVSPLLIKNSCCQRAFLRGAFLCIGSMSDPQKSYHLEFVCTDEDKARQLQSVIQGFDIEAKIVLRKKYYVVYLKEGSGIVDLLNVCEAPIALMKLENLRIVKEMRNSVNRRVNCETANITKTVTAATRQIEDIIYIRDHYGLENLPEPLSQMAEVRLENPDAPLKELGEYLDPPVGKSGVNHRLRKLSELADRIRT